MGRNRQKKPLLENVRITDVGAEGKAIARVNEMVIFTTHAVPGDIVDIQVTNKRKKYMEGRVMAIHEYSLERQDAFCEHFGICGGCKWQFLPYERQLFYKQKQVTDQLRRIGHVELPEISPILGSRNITGYRNKLEFSFSNKRWLTEEEIGRNLNFNDMNALGFHVPGMFDKIIDIKKCWLQGSPSNEIRNFVRDYALEHQLEFFDIRNISGFLRNIIIRTATTGDLMVIISFFRENKKQREQLLDTLAARFPQITSLMYVINQKRNDTLTDQEILTYRGNDHIFEEMEGLRFKIDPKSFYQTNPEQAYELYKTAREFAGLTGSETVYDLYTGTGTIANFVSSKARRVVGIEYVPEAIDDARTNAALNKIENTVFYAGDMKDLLNHDFIAYNGQPDVIITDPPRAGMHENVIQAILNANARRIVYVSCNPATQARDIRLLSENYKVTKIQPVDMFPHTHHVENVALMEQIERIRPTAP
ncbi:MAG: 23S rRNA (uracil(1939)-C(5))-methyltransferase RlmD [Prolixibacteraceae bacterium]|nr:23S rRNA (uracil(1939)-C(5))-methyltransferase RlmD [Prolixibacteraceae bacterium]